jgi:hypothetical protein
MITKSLSLGNKTGYFMGTISIHVGDSNVQVMIKCGKFYWIYKGKLLNCDTCLL